MIAAILEKGTVVQLLFTDVVKRGMIRVLFTSAYAENSIIHNVELDPAVDFFSKPYDRERIAMTLRRQEHRRPRINRSQRAGSFERPPPRRNIRAYRNAHEIRARVRCPLTVRDIPRSQPIRSAVAAAGGM